MEILRIILIVIFLVASVAVTVVVLLQEGKSAGLGSIGGSGTSGDSYWNKNKKHSLEGKFEKWTKITAAALVVSAFILMFLPSAPKGGTKQELVVPSTVTNQTTNEDGTTNIEVSPDAIPEANIEVNPSEAPATDAPASEAPAN